MTRTTPRFTRDAFLAIVDHAATEFDPDHDHPRTMWDWLEEFKAACVDASGELEHLAQDDADDEDES